MLAGDFFASVPEADIYLLKHILHDWNDEEAVRILKGCREAMRPGGRVIVIERLLGEIGEPGLAPLKGKTGVPSYHCDVFCRKGYAEAKDLFSGTKILLLKSPPHKRMPDRTWTFALWRNLQNGASC